MSQSTKYSGRPFIIAWVLGCIFYFLEYVVRASPAVMIPELSGRFKVSVLTVSSILGVYYYTYAFTSLIAGVALDRAGAKYSISVGIGILSVGCVLFAFPHVFAEYSGRLFQGVGSAFAFTGCVYLASHGFSARYIATAIGFTQCVGMLGGSAGQFIVGPLIQKGLNVSLFWIGIGIICGLLCLIIFFVTPREKKLDEENSKRALSLLQPYKLVFGNLQSYLSGVVSGLLFAPTTIFAMTWGIAFFRHDRHVSYFSAVLICFMVPLGWVVGAPLLGWISDKIGRRKPMLIGGSAVMMLSFAQLVFLPGLLPGVLTMIVFGIGSGAAMIPYTIIKEANLDKVKGSATGAIIFLTFGVTALLNPVFAELYGKSLMSTTDHEAHFKFAGIFWLAFITLAILVSLLIKETGTKLTKPAKRKIHLVYLGNKGSG